MYTISIIVDNPRSWMNPYAQTLTKTLQSKGHTVSLLDDAQKVGKGDIAFFLSCEHIVGQDILSRNTHNIVVHSSALPKGKGWSPLTWQIIEGKNEIPITLFEAVEGVDSGDIYIRETMKFEGHELLEELQDIQGKKIIEMVCTYVEKYPMKGEPQKGEESFYPRRKPKDSELDVSKPLKDLFNQFRIADNEKYPTFFNLNGTKYILKIYKDKNIDTK